MFTLRSFRRATAIGLVGALAVAACGSDDGGSPSGGSPEPGATDEPPPTSAEPGADDGDEQSPTTESADDVVGHDPDAVISVIGYSPPAHVDPVRGVPACEHTHLRMIYDSLVRLDLNGAPAPGLAESWEVIDDLTFQINLRDGVVFQDGTPFDADAVRIHLERGQAHPESTITGVLDVVERIEVVDDLTLRLHLSEPRAGTLTTILAERAGMVPSPQAVDSGGDQYGTTSAVGAGPYELVELNPAQILSVRAWGGRDYWADDRRLIAGIDFHPVDDTLGIQRIQSGEIDYMATKDDNLSLVVDEPDLEHRLAPTNTYAQIFINFGVEPFDDVRVRQALNHALDRELLNEVLTGGAGEVAWGPLAPTSWAHDTSIEGLYPFDPERARELLAEAGHPDGITFTAAMIDHPYYTRMAQAVQDMLVESDIFIELETVTGAEINNALYIRQDYAAAVTAYAGSTDPSITLEARYASSGNSNPSGETVDGLEELLAEGARLVDQDDRAELYRQAERLVMENALDVPIFFLGGLSVFDPSVRGIEKGYETCAIGNFIDPPVYVAVD